MSGKKYNLIGLKFGRLQVLKQLPNVNNRSCWECICDCGNIRRVLGQSLKSGATISCGCYHKEITSIKTIKDITGQKFGKWTVLSLTNRRAKNGGIYVKCKCDCGTIREVASSGLIQGNTTSCKNCATLKQFCKYGHDTTIYGRSPTGSCRMCIKNKALFRNYGITIDEYIKLFEYQNGKCAICGAELKFEIGEQGWGRGTRAELDHKHDKTKDKKSTVRGLLCGGRWAGCNRKLGRLDKPEWLQAALQYVQHPPAKEALKGTNGPKTN